LWGQFFCQPIGKHGAPAWAIRVNILDTESIDTPRTKKNWLIGDADHQLTGRRTPFLVCGGLAYEQRVQTTGTTFPQISMASVPVIL